MDGIAIINKPVGITSHRVVEIVRKRFPGVKVGHSGTLDPMASGVLIVCLGKATRVTEYIMEMPKKYRAGIVLGVTTDSDDATGSVIETKIIPRLQRKEIESILEGFLGQIKQLPPLYSAVKHKGKPLYYWTRKGIDVPRKVRNTYIYSIKMLKYSTQSKPNLLLDISCAKGTYIRTLAADIGQAIGCGGHLSELIRTCVGPFTIEKALTIENSDLFNLEKLEKHLYGLDSAFQDYPKITLEDAKIKALKNGQFIYNIDESWHDYVAEKIIAVYDCRGQFRALVVSTDYEGGKVLKTLKYLAE